MTSQEHELENLNSAVSVSASDSTTRNGTAVPTRATVGHPAAQRSGTTPSRISSGLSPSKPNSVSVVNLTQTSDHTQSETTVSVARTILVASCTPSKRMELGPDVSRGVPSKETPPAASNIFRFRLRKHPRRALRRKRSNRPKIEPVMEEEKCPESSLENAESHSPNNHRAQRQTDLNWMEVTNRIQIERLKQKKAPRDSGSKVGPALKQKLNPYQSLKEAIKFEMERNSFFVNGTSPIQRLAHFQPSLTVFLYEDAFICRNLSSTRSDGNAQPYNRDSRLFLHMIDLGFVPYDLMSQVPCKFYDGNIIVDIVDYRSTGEMFPLSSSSISLPNVLNTNGKGDSTLKKPIYRRVLLKPTLEMLIHSIEDFAKLDKQMQNVSALKENSPARNLKIEERLLLHLYPEDEICLDPSTQVFKAALAIENSDTSKRFSLYTDEYRYRALEKPQVKKSLSRLAKKFGSKALLGSKPVHSLSSPSCASSAKQESLSGANSAGSSTSATKRKRPSSGSQSEDREKATKAKKTVSKTSHSPTLSKFGSSSSAKTAKWTKAKPGSSTSMASPVRNGVAQFGTKPVQKPSKETVGVGMNMSMGMPSLDGIEGVGNSSVLAGEWDFIESILDDSPALKFSLTPETSPSNAEGNSRSGLGPHYTASAFPFPFSSTPYEWGPSTVKLCSKYSNETPLQPDWMKVVDSLQRKYNALTKTNSDALTKVSAGTGDPSTRVGGIVHLARKMGKARWPTEIIAICKARARQQSVKSPQHVNPLKSPSSGMYVCMRMQ